MPQFVSTQIGKGTVLQAPTADGTVGQFLKTDGAGNLSFDTVAATPAGSDTYVQFNDGGAFGASANLTWDDATLQVTGTDTAAPVLVAKMPASHADNAFEVQDSTGTVKAGCDQDGHLFTEHGLECTTLGKNLGSSWQNREVCIGYGAATGNEAVGIGHTVSSGGTSVSIGRSAQSGNACVVIGWGAGGLAQNVVNIGSNTSSSGIHTVNDASIAIGKGVTAGVGSCVIGSSVPNGITDFVFGGSGLATNAFDITMHPAGANGTDVAGKNYILHAGQGTGTGAGGHLIFQTAAAGGTGSSLNSLATMLELTDDSKIGFFAATPVVQQAGTGETTGFTAGAGTAVNDDSTFTGNVGTAAYRISDIVKALKNYGLLASS